MEKLYSIFGGKDSDLWTKEYVRQYWSDQSTSIDLCDYSQTSQLELKLLASTKLRGDRNLCPIHPDHLFHVSNVTSFDILQWDVRNHDQEVSLRSQGWIQQILFDQL